VTLLMLRMVTMMTMTSMASMTTRIGIDMGHLSERIDDGFGQCGVNGLDMGKRHVVAIAGIHEVRHLLDEEVGLATHYMASKDLPVGTIHKYLDK